MRKRHIAESLFESVAGVEKKARTAMPELEVEERIHSMVECDLVISAEDAAPAAIASYARCASPLRTKRDK